MKKIIIAGAGLSGATLARRLADYGYLVTVVDKRNTIGGNVYDFVDENGIRVQQYGPHIFHTNYKEVFDYLSNFTEWYKYEHKVLGNIKGKLVPVPFNLTSLYELYEKEQADKIKDILLAEVGLNVKAPVLELKKHPNELIKSFADFVYENVFYTYTKKQWGFRPEDLGETVMNRVPVYVSYEDRYFTDTYQFQPVNGFTPMVEKMLDHKNIKVVLGKNINEILTVKNGKIYENNEVFDGILIYTGRIDELFNFKFGKLSFRSLDFVFETHDMSSYQPAAVVNYNTSEDYTRISEFSKFCCEPQKKTVIVKEYSKECKDDDIPYYPIPTAEKFKEYELYKNEAEKIENLYLLGRLANYKYINMDVAVKNALELAEQIKEKYGQN